MPRLVESAPFTASFRGLVPLPGLLGLKPLPGLLGLWFLPDLPGLSTLRTVAMSTRVPSARRAKRAGVCCSLAVVSPGPELGAPSDLGLLGLLFGLLLGLSPRVALRNRVVTEPKFFFSFSPLGPLILGLPRPGLERPDSCLAPGLRGLRADLGLPRSDRGLRGLDTALGGPSSSSSFSHSPSARSTAQIRYLRQEADVQRWLLRTTRQAQSKA